MADCECLPKCPFFNDRMADMPALAGMMKKKYCLNDNDTCARHIVFAALGSENVPDDLFPSQIDRARKIVAVT
jgi:hypothetical protein